MNRNAVFLATFLCALLFFAPAGFTQGIWEELQGSKVEQKRLPPPIKTREEMCLAVLKDGDAPKCRGYYLENGFSVKWKGLHPQVTHGLEVEILVRERDAVLCHNVSWYLDHLSPCIFLFDVSNLPMAPR